MRHSPSSNSFAERENGEEDSPPSTSVELAPLTLGLFPRDRPVSGVQSVVQAQRQAGFDVVVDGQLGWDQGLASPVHAADGVTAGTSVSTIPGAATASQPRIVGPVQAGNVLAPPLRDASSRSDSVAVVVPGPYSLSTIVEDQYYGDDREVLAAMADLVAAELSEVPAHEQVIVHEPRLATDPPKDAFTAIPDAVDTAVAPTDSEVVLVPYGGVPTDRIHAHILDAAIDVLGYDFNADHDRAIELITEYGSTDAIAICALDVDTPGVPSVSTLRNRTTWVRDVLPDVVSFDSAYLAPNGGFMHCSLDRLDTILTTLVAVTDPENSVAN